MKLWRGDPSGKVGPIHTGVERGFLHHILSKGRLLGVRLFGVRLVEVRLLRDHRRQDLLLRRDISKFRVGFIERSVIPQCLFCCRIIRCSCLLSLVLLFPLSRVRGQAVGGKRQGVDSVEMLERLGAFSMGDERKVGNPLKRVAVSLLKPDFGILKVGAVEPPHADCRFFRALPGMESQCAISRIWPCQRDCDAA
jgi:hypothetical protein